MFTCMDVMLSEVVDIIYDSNALANATRRLIG